METSRRGMAVAGLPRRRRFEAAAGVPVHTRPVVARATAAQVGDGQVRQTVIVHVTCIALAEEADVRGAPRGEGSERPRVVHVHAIGVHVHVVAVRHEKVKPAVAIDVRERAAG